MWWLCEQGMSPLARNLEVDGGELDLVMSDRGRRVAVEVRSVTRDGDPIDAVDRGKRQHVRKLASGVGISRVDFLGVGFRSWGVEVHWVPG